MIGQLLGLVADGVQVVGFVHWDRTGWRFTTVDVGLRQELSQFQQRRRLVLRSVVTDQQRIEERYQWVGPEHEQFGEALEDLLLSETGTVVSIRWKEEGYG